MFLASPVIAALSAVALLGAIALVTLILCIISIHRTSRMPLSEVHHEHGGSLSRRVLTGGRNTNREASE